MAPTSAKKVARRVIEQAFNQGNLEVIDALVSKGFVGHDPALPEAIKGPEAVKEMIAAYRAAFPDLKMTIMDQVADGDPVATRWRTVGRQEGELWGIAPTGKRVTVTGITFERVVEGQIVESWDNWDTLGLLQQLEAVPETLATA